MTYYDKPEYSTQEAVLYDANGSVVAHIPVETIADIEGTTYKIQGKLWLSGTPPKEAEIYDNFWENLDNNRLSFSTWEEVGIGFANDVSIRKIGLFGNE